MAEVIEEQGNRERGIVRAALSGRSPEVIALAERFVGAHGLDRLAELLEVELRRRASEAR